MNDLQVQFDEQARAALTGFTFHEIVRGRSGNTHVSVVGMHTHHVVGWTLKDNDDPVVYLGGLLNGVPAFLRSQGYHLTPVATLPLSVKVAGNDLTRIHEAISPELDVPMSQSELDTTALLLLRNNAVISNTFQSFVDHLYATPGLTARVFWAMAARYALKSSHSATNPDIVGLVERSLRLTAEMERRYSRIVSVDMSAPHVLEFPAVG